VATVDLPKQLERTPCYPLHRQMPKAIPGRQLLLSRDTPILIEVVDVRAKIEIYLAAVEPMIQSGLVTIEDIRVLRYGVPAGHSA
jgi:hypothetical protein